MKGRVRAFEWSTVPGDIQHFVSKGQFFLTPDREYVVHAVSVYNAVSFLLVINDIDTPVFVPAWVFEATNQVLDDDWVCSLVLGHGVDLVLGPPFVASNLEAYNRVVDQEPAVVALLFQRNNSLGSCSD